MNDFKVMRLGGGFINKKQVKTKLLSNPQRTSYKLVILFGDNVKTKIFDGANAKQRAFAFQDQVVNFLN